MEVELKIYRLFLGDTNGSSRDILSSVSSSIRAEDKSKNWLNSATNDFDSTPDRNITLQKINGSKEEAGAPAPAESDPKPAFDSTSFDNSPKKCNLMCDSSKIFIPSIVPTQPPSFAATAHVSQPALLPLMGMKLPKLEGKFSSDPLEWPKWSGQFCRHWMKPLLMTTSRWNEKKNFCNWEGQSFNRRQWLEWDFVSSGLANAGWIFWKT